jgi:hypothetical protein
MSDNTKVNDSLTVTRSIKQVFYGQELVIIHMIYCYATAEITVTKRKNVMASWAVQKSNDT